MFINNTISEIELIDTFCSLFYDELDSWFSSDIACCENCYNEYISKWPSVYSRYLEFQTNSIDIQSFYSGSRLSMIFSEEQYLELVKNIECPRCGNIIEEIIYSYNFRFDLPENFEEQLEEVEELARKTPFLILLHPLTQQVYATIEKISKNVEEIFINKKYYRARTFEKGKIY